MKREQEGWQAVQARWESQVEMREQDLRKREEKLAAQGREMEAVEGRIALEALERAAANAERAAFAAMPPPVMRLRDDALDVGLGSSVVLEGKKPSLRQQPEVVTVSRTPSRVVRQKHVPEPSPSPPASSPISPLAGVSAPPPRSPPRHSSSPHRQPSPESQSSPHTSPIMTEAEAQLRRRADKLRSRMQGMSEASKSPTSPAGKARFAARGENLHAGSKHAWGPRAAHLQSMMATLRVSGDKEATSKKGSKSSTKSKNAASIEAFFGVSSNQSLDRGSPPSSPPADQQVPSMGDSTIQDFFVQAGRSPGSNSRRGKN